MSKGYLKKDTSLDKVERTKQDTTAYDSIKHIMSGGYDEIGMQWHLENIEKALRVPTAYEVCEAIRKWIPISDTMHFDIIYNEEKRCFYRIIYDWHIHDENPDKIDIIARYRRVGDWWNESSLKPVYKIEDEMPAYLMVLIARFYEGLEE